MPIHTCAWEPRDKKEGSRAHGLQTLMRAKTIAAARCARKVDIRRSKRAGRKLSMQLHRTRKQSKAPFLG